MCFDAAEGLYSGVLNVSSCRYGVPVFVSYPHFFGADPYYKEQVEGMHPDEEKHQFYMTLEPVSKFPQIIAWQNTFSVFTKSLTFSR